jgi:CheY-like chemotaxis protein
MIKVLHVDDDSTDQEMLQLRMQRLSNNLDFVGASSVDEALDLLKSKHFDVILSDFNMPKRDGIQFLRTIRSEGNDTPFIFVTGQGNEEVATNAFHNGADDYYAKSNDFAHYQRLLNSIIKLVVSHRRLAKHSWLEMAFRKSQSRLNVLEEVYSALPFPMLLFKRDGEKYSLEVANPSAEKALSSSRDELNGAPIENIFSDESALRLHTSLNDLGEGNESAMIQCRYRQTPQSESELDIKIFRVGNDKVCLVVV